jgi:hypothetical protein
MKVREGLGAVQRQQMFDRFGFNQDFTGDDKIGSVAAFEIHAFVMDS